MTVLKELGINWMQNKRKSKNGEAIKLEKDHKGKNEQKDRKERLHREMKGKTKSWTIKFDKWEIKEYIRKYCGRWCKWQYEYKNAYAESKDELQKVCRWHKQIRWTKEHTIKCGQKNSRSSIKYLKKQHKKNGWRYW